MAEHEYINSPRQLAERAKVGSRTVDRILKGEHAGQLDTLEAIATALECAAWQLLVPGLDPKEMPVLATPTGPEAALYAQFRALRKQIEDETGAKSDKPRQSKAKSR